MPEQVQDFYPTPSTMATCMYYTGVDPRTMKKVYIPVNPHEKAMQRALIQYRRPENYDLVKEALTKAGRTDLIGFDKKCLIPPRKMKQSVSVSKNNGKSNQTKGKRKNENQKEKPRKIENTLPDKRNTGRKKSLRYIHKKKK